MASSWDAEGSRLTLLKNQAAIMAALGELVQSPDVQQLLSRRVEATHRYLAEKQRQYG